MIKLTLFFSNLAFLSTKREQIVELDLVSAMSAAVNHIFNPSTNVLGSNIFLIPLIKELEFLKKIANNE